MGERVVAADNHIERAIDAAAQSAKVSLCEGESCSSRFCFAARPLEGGSAQVACVNPVTAERKANRLGTDSARAIEQRQRRRPSLTAYDPIDRERLGFDGGIQCR